MQLGRYRDLAKKLVMQRQTVSLAVDARLGLHNQKSARANYILGQSSRFSVISYTLYTSL
jgi:hypothetical protein